MGARKSGIKSSDTGVRPADAFPPWTGSAPLAARMRPRTLEEFVGQEHILGEGKLLRRAIQADRLGSIILAGPPGSGKTTLARVIAGVTRSEFETLNAVFAGVKDIREVVARARARQSDGFLGQKTGTILFVDEVHRFNKAQQDALLPHVEDGTLTFVGATTENPYFEVIKALVSRSRIFELKALRPEDLLAVMKGALQDAERGYGGRTVVVTSEAMEHLARMAHGDARNALNALELAVETTPCSGDGGIRVDLRVAEESIQRRALLYDKDGDAHYDTISAFIKSLRGSDPDAALYWMARMIAAGEDPRFIARRLVIFASEDVGLADPLALTVATAAAHAVDYVGLPECQYNLSQAVLHLALAPKSNSAGAYFKALQAVEAAQADEVPDHLKDPTRDRKGLGHGTGYRYPHAFREHWVAQQYLPETLQGMVLYEAGNQGVEPERASHLRRWRERQLDAMERLKRTAPERERAEKQRDRLRKEYGDAAVELRDQVLSLVGLDRVRSALVIGRPRLVAWGAIESNPLIKIYAAYTEMVEAKEERAAMARDRIDRVLRVLVVDHGGLPVAARSVDAVLGWRVFGRSDAKPALASELFRVLAEDGELALAEREEDRRGLEGLLERAGFEDLELRMKGKALLVWARRPGRSSQPARDPT